MKLVRALVIVLTVVVAVSLPARGGADYRVKGDRKMEPSL